MAQVELINPKVRAMCHDGTATPDEFWAHAAEALSWFRRWDQVFDWDPEQPDSRGRYFRWFSGALTNLAWNCVDRTSSGVGAVTLR